MELQRIPPCVPSPPHSPHPPCEGRDQHESGPRPLGMAWIGQDRDISTAEREPEHSPHFLTPTALAPSISLPPRPGQAASSSVFPGTGRPCCLLPERPEHSARFLTLADSLPFLLSFLTPLDGW